MKLNRKTFLGILIFTTILQGQFGFARGGGTSANSPRAEGQGAALNSPSRGIITYRVIPFIDYYESAKLPPDLWVKFEIKCYQTFIKVIREDIVDPTTLKDTIVIGALVSENNALPCSSSSEMTDFGGSTFSGREFEVKSVE